MHSRMPLRMFHIIVAMYPRGTSLAGILKKKKKRRPGEGRNRGYAAGGPRGADKVSGSMQTGVRYRWDMGTNSRVSRRAGRGTDGRGSAEEKTKSQSAQAVCPYSGEWKCAVPGSAWQCFSRWSSWCSVKTCKALPTEAVSNSKLHQSAAR